MNTSSWLFGSTCSFQQTLVTSPEGHVWSEGVEHCREREAQGWEGAQIPPTMSPLPMTNIHGRFSSAGTQLETAPNTTRTLTGLVPPSSSSLGGDKSPRQPSLSSPRGGLSHLCRSVPGKRSQGVPTLGGDAQRLQEGPDFSWLCSGATAQPCLPLAMGKLPWRGDVGARAARGQHHQCQAEGKKGNPCAELGAA